MAEIRLKTKISNDKLTCVLEMHVDGGPVGHAVFDASTLEGFIRSLANDRSGMADQVAMDLDPNARLDAIIDPAWKVQHHPETGGLVLALRHPGLGWVAFVLPPDSADHLGQWLSGGVAE